MNPKACRCQSAERMLVACWFSHFAKTILGLIAEFERKVSLFETRAKEVRFGRMNAPPGRDPGWDDMAMLRGETRCATRDDYAGVNSRINEA